MSKTKQRPITGSFQKNLEHSVGKRVLFLVLASILLFIIGQNINTAISDKVNSAHHLQDLTNVFLEMEYADREFLYQSEIMDAATNILLKKSTQDLTLLQTQLRHFNEINPVYNDIVLTDQKGQISYTTFGESHLTEYFLSYLNAISYHAKLNGNEVRRGVYFDTDNYPDTLYIKPVYNNAEVIGYVTLVLSGADWNYYMSEKNYDGVIVDQRNNVMYASRHAFISTSNKFCPETKHSYTLLGHCFFEVFEERYLIVSHSIPDCNATVYSLIYYPRNQVFLIAIIISIFMGTGWYLIARDISRKMAEKNASSIAELVKEIQIIQRENPSHRITLKSKDEFSEVGTQINHMLDFIEELNHKNTELLQLNNKIEIEQLTAQINPHFLYNTLEIIRNLVLFDPDKSSDLIECLTDVLRYSVNQVKREVVLSEDMKYIQKYLEIQKIRFGDRFHCTIDITEECANIIVPKLLLQPLIENSIKYGFRKRMDLNIHIIGRMLGHDLEITCFDNGLGMEREKAENLIEQLEKHDNTGSSIGLRNLSRRLYLRFGQGSGITIHNEEGVGFTVIVTIRHTEIGGTYV